METVLERTALTLSYLWEALALLFSSGRMAALRLKGRLTRYEMALGVEEDYAFLCDAVRTLQRMEKELFHSNLDFEPSRLAAVLAYQVAVKRLRQRMLRDFAPATPATASGHRQVPSDGEVAQ